MEFENGLLALNRVIDYLTLYLEALMLYQIYSWLSCLVYGIVKLVVTLFFMWRWSSPSETEWGKSSAFIAELLVDSREEIVNLSVYHSHFNVSLLLIKLKTFYVSFM